MPGLRTPVLAVPRRETKTAKDALQALGMLDRARKAEQMAAGSRIALPLTLDAATQLQALAPAALLPNAPQPSTPSGTKSNSHEANPDADDLGDSADNGPSVQEHSSANAGISSYAAEGNRGLLESANCHRSEAIMQAHKQAPRDPMSAPGSDPAYHGRRRETGDGKVDERQSAPAVEESAKGTLVVLLGLLRAGVAQLEWRELLASRRAGGPSPAAKLRAGMQQLLSAHGAISRGLSPSLHDPAVMVAHVTCGCLVFVRALSSCMPFGG